MARYFALGVIVDCVMVEVRDRPHLRRRPTMSAIDRAHELGDVAILREICMILQT